MTGFSIFTNSYKTQFKMKTNFFTSLSIALFLGVGMMGCSQEDDMTRGGGPSVSSIDFLHESLTIEQVGDSVQVPLKLERVSTTAGFVLVRLSGDAVYGVDYVTRPAAENGVIKVEFIKDLHSIPFRILRAYSGAAAEEKTIFLTLENPSQGYRLGSNVSSSIKLNKVTEGAHVNFAEELVHLSESEPDGYQLELGITGAIFQSEQVTVQIVAPAGITYGTHFSTLPAQFLNVLQLDVQPGSAKQVITIYPVDDNVLLGTYDLKFRIVGTTGNLEPGTHSQLTVRIEENDDAAVYINSIAELRSKYDEHSGGWWLPHDYFVEGVITSKLNVNDARTAYIQDETGGIMISFTSENMLHLGDKVRLNLKGGTGSIVNEQKSITGVADRLGVRLAEGIYVAPAVITPAQLATGAYEGQRVRMLEVAFTEADGAMTFEGNRAITSNGSGAIVTTYASAGFGHHILPQGIVAVTGIVGDWGRILPQEITDIVK